MHLFHEEPRDLEETLLTSRAMKSEEVADREGISPQIAPGDRLSHEARRLGEVEHQ